MLWVLIVKDTLYLHRKKPIILKPVEATVEEENFRQRFSINEVVYPDLVSKGHFGRSLNFYQLIGGITPVINFSFAVRGMPPTSNRLYLNGIPLTNLMLSGLAPLPINERTISSALVYRGDAPVEYDGFLGGVIDMKVEPYRNEVQIGLPTTYVFYRGLYGQYSNLTYTNYVLFPQLRANGNTEDYSFALIERFKNVRFTALYTKSWLDVSYRDYDDETRRSGHTRYSVTLRGYGASLLYEYRSLNALIYLSGTDNSYLKESDVAESFLYRPKNLRSGMQVSLYGFGMEASVEDEFSDLTTVLEESFKKGGFPLKVRHITYSLFWGRRWHVGRDFLYAGVRLNRSKDTVWNERESGWEYGIEGLIPTFRLHYKHFWNDYSASKVFLGSSYQNYAPWIPYIVVEMFPASYFRRYPYAYTGVVGQEMLLGDYALEINGYLRIHDPYTFYDWNDTTAVEGAEDFADVMLNLGKDTRVLSVGIDYSLLDKAKRNFRVSGFLGKSRFIGGATGPAPWDMRWSISVQTDMVSVLFSDGIVSYEWRKVCTEDGGCTYRFKSRRGLFTLLVGLGKRQKWKGWDLSWGMGNVMFLWFKAWLNVSEVTSPVGLYKVLPLLYVRLSREI